VAQIDIWRAAKSENEHLEFKEAKNNFDSNDLFSYCVALANERGGILLLGIANRPLPRPVVGTKAYLNVSKTANDILKLHFRVDVEEVQHPDGRVLVFHVPSRPVGHPYQLDGAYLMRSGESLVAMTTDQIRKILAEEGSGRRQRDILVAGLLIVLVPVSIWFANQFLRVPQNVLRPPWFAKSPRIEFPRTTFPIPRLRTTSSR
jgi:hypothetical protein